MESIKEKVKHAFESSYEEYKLIVNDPEGEGFKPWSNEERLSIHETNQVANFLFAYKQRNKELNKDCITWHELSIPYMKDGKNKTNHVDGFIIDGDNVIFIEAKRFSRVNARQEELYQDLKNIVELSDIERKKFKMRLPNGLSNKYNFYCLLLADYWIYRNLKTKTLLPESIDWKTIVSGYEERDEVKKKTNLLDFNCTDQLGSDKIYHLAYALFELNNF